MVLLRGRGVLGSDGIGLTSGASSSGPEVRRIWAGISVRMELIRASNFSASFLTGEGTRESGFLGEVSDFLRCRILTGVEPGPRSATFSNLFLILAGDWDGTVRRFDGSGTFGMCGEGWRPLLPTDTVSGAFRTGGRSEDMLRSMATASVFVGSECGRSMVWSPVTPLSADRTGGGFE